MERVTVTLVPQPVPTLRVQFHEDGTHTLTWENVSFSENENLNDGAR